MTPIVPGPDAATAPVKAAETQDADQKPKRKKKLMAKFKMAGHLAAPPKRAFPKPRLVTLTVQFVEINRLSDIDILNQRFRAEFVVQFAFVGGANDATLSDPSDKFPLDAYGRPTFRPSASWYAAQIDFNNALDFKQLDAKVLPSGDDLLLLFRFEGTFSEMMELEDFPCDVQDLTISLSFNCRTLGMMPLDIVASHDLTTGIMPDGFVDGRLWNLHREVGVNPGTVGLKADRMFPSVELNMVVGRQPSFFLLNLAMPVFFFVPMAALQYCVPRQQTADRLSVSLAIVLTAIAHKFSMTSIMPAVSYLTFLDKYVVWSLLLIVLITFQGSIVGHVETMYCKSTAIFADIPDTWLAEVSDPDADYWDISTRLHYSSKFGFEPLYHTDPFCPYSLHGRWSVFDYIDWAMLAFDALMWLLLQASTLHTAPLPSRDLSTFSHLLSIDVCRRGRSSGSCRCDAISRSASQRSVTRRPRALTLS